MKKLFGLLLITFLTLNAFSQNDTIYTRNESFLYKEKGFWTEKIATIPMNYMLIPQKYDSYYYFVEYDTLSGWIFFIDVERRDYIKTKFTLQAYIDKYNEQFGTLVFKNKLMVDMNDEMCIDGWGQPDKIKPYGRVWEKWTYYDNATLLFKNRILVAWR